MYLHKYNYHYHNQVLARFVQIEYNKQEEIKKMQKWN